MSWWTYTKEPDGKVSITSHDISGLSFVIMMLLGLLVAIFVPNLNVRGMRQFFFSAGFACLLAAKISLFRRGVWFSWGTSQMTQPWSLIYKVGYVLIGLGALISIAAYHASH